MKINKILIISFFLLLLISLAFLAFNPFSSRGFNKRVKAKTKTYVQQELKINEFDSVTVLHIDTLTALGYAKLTLEMLDNLYDTYENAMIAEPDEKKSHILELQLIEIENQIAIYQEIIDDSKTDDKKLLYYMINAAYYQKGDYFPFIYLLTDKEKIFTYDPFNTDPQS